jgi:prepilin signal peptidase PulO-like enzyme (type II secretory pathway)
MLELLPPDISFYVALYALLALAATAVVDARTGLVPPLPLAIATLLLMVDMISGGSAQAFTVPLQAVLVYIGIWIVNEIHYRFIGRDALGMGDAHWSLVATLLFGWQTVLMAWGAGAWLALAWMGGCKLVRRPVAHIYFVPFLFIALVLIKLWPLLAA